MMSQSSGVLLFVLVLHLTLWNTSEGAQGPLVPIQWYTHPDGLEAVNGSQGRASCDALHTVYDPPQCTSGELTDGVFLQPEDMTTMKWAQGFFTVNRGNSTTIEIGFRLERSVVIGEVQLSLLICPAWGIGAPNITFYGAQGTVRTSQLGSITVADDTSCTVQNLTVSFDETFRNYLLVFNYETDPYITWLYLGEVQFFELLQTPPPTLTSPSSTSVGSPFPAPLSTPSPHMTQGPSPGNSDKKDGNDTPVIIIAVAVLIVLLLLCTTTLILIIFLCVRMRRKQQISEVEKLQNAMLEHETVELVSVNGELKKGSAIEPPTYSTVQKQSKSLLGIPSPLISDYTVNDKPTEQIPAQTAANQPKETVESSAAEGALYAPVKKEPPPSVPDKSSELVEYLETKQVVTPGKGPCCTTEVPAEGALYASVEKEPPPSVPDKSSELVEYLETKQVVTPGEGPHYTSEEEKSVPEIPQKSTKLVDYLESKTPTHTALAEEYAEISQQIASNESPYSPPLLTTEGNAGNVYETFDDEFDLGNPDDIYTEPNMCGDPTEGIYEAVYSEPLMPSLFTAKESETENTEELHPYAPIYTTPTNPPKAEEKAAEVTEANTEEVRELGVGMFGQVVLAKTVGLSLKDLRLDPTDDDKSISVLVAMKKLKPDAPPNVREAFMKELEFMGRLNNSNVVRILGVCAGESPFILMEYMDKGDLNQYLKMFSEVIPTDGLCSAGQIAASTLLYMSTEIASGMKYLASLNIVHRDLATRNCLVGNDFTIKVADFGMSRSLYDSHYYRIQGHAILPVRWMATECFYGKFSQKSDVWAFGVTLWEIFELAQTHPYNGLSDQDVIRDAVKGAERIIPFRPKACPENVYRQIILRCWAPNPSERPNFEELYASLSSL